MNIGDIFWVDFPTGAGRAQAGGRPALLVQGIAASAKLPTILLIPLTTQLDALRFPGTVLIEANPKNGLSRASIALTFQITVMDKRYIGAQLGHVSEQVMQAIWLAFDEVTERRNTQQTDDSDEQTENNES